MHTYQKCINIDVLWQPKRPKIGQKYLKVAKKKFLFPSSVDNQNIPFCSDNIVQMAGHYLGSKFCERKENKMAKKWPKSIFGVAFAKVFVACGDTHKTLVCVNYVAQMTSGQPQGPKIVLSKMKSLEG